MGIYEETQGRGVCISIVANSRISRIKEGSLTKEVQWVTASHHSKQGFVPTREVKRVGGIVPPVVRILGKMGLFLCSQRGYSTSVS